MITIYGSSASGKGELACEGLFRQAAISFQRRISKVEMRPSSMKTVIANSYLSCIASLWLERRAGGWEAIGISFVL
jgi:hypothetical protein